MATIAEAITMVTVVHTATETIVARLATTAEHIS
jgi:hypothetical protein